MIFLPISLYLNNNIIENFEYEENDFKKKQDSNNLICMNKYVIYFICFILSCYAAYLAYNCNKTNPTVILKKNMPNWVMSVWGFFLGWVYLLWFFFAHHVFKIASCNSNN